MVPDGRTDGMDGRTDDAKTISLRLRRGIIKTEIIMENLLTIQENENSSALFFYSAESQELCTDVNSNVISDVTSRYDSRYVIKGAKLE